MDLKKNNSVIAEINAHLTVIEKELIANIGGALISERPGRDPCKCDRTFGIYSQVFLRPCIANGLTFRAALAGTALVHAVLHIERQERIEFHKGALFHDVGIANYLCGNVDEYEYCLAMADEENLKTRGAAYKRGTLNLQADSLTNQTIVERMQCVCDLLNGSTTAYRANYAFLIGAAPVGTAQVDSWRQTLEPLEQFEFLRIIHDMYQFLGSAMPDYETVKDHPFILLRLAKTLSHLAQWVESILTRWQGGGSRPLSPKLNQDADFGATLSAAAGNPQIFSGNCPHGADVNIQLNQLTADLLLQAAGSQRQWRVLRVLYIVRNATAHTIDPNLTIYTRRNALLVLMQSVFASVFVIAQLKHKPLP